MSSDRQSKAMADKLLAETSDLMATLQAVQTELQAWSTQATSSRSLLHRPQQSGQRAACRKNTLAQLRQTVELSKKRINNVCSQILKNIKVAEEKRSQSLKKSTAPANVLEVDGQKIATANRTVFHNQRLPFRKDHQAIGGNLSQRENDQDIGETPAIRTVGATMGAGTLDGSVSRGDPTSLRYYCEPTDLGQNMVSTIQKARTALSEQSVDERGYLILTTAMSWNHSDLDEMLRAKTRCNDEYSKGFLLQDGGKGFHHIYRDDGAKLEFNLPSLEAGEPLIAPEREFQASIDSIGEQRISVSYLIGPHASNTETGQMIGKLLDPGPITSQRPDLPGINSPYWYVSYERGTPANMHIEDGYAGSANMLLAGAEKHWIVVRRSSVQKLEESVRAEFHGQRCSQFLRHHHVVLSPLWLRERGIEFDLACQRPGEIMVTLPGLTYHEIRNIGANFAVAINYEFPDAQESPSGYKWCQRGPKRCGLNAIRFKDFKISSTLEDRQNDQTNGDKVNNIIEIIDDKPYELGGFLRLPEKQSNVYSDIESLIKASIDQNIAPHWFDCKDHLQLNTKLQQFLPGEELCDDTLQKLLILIALRHGYHVVDSLTLNLATITASKVISDAEVHAAGVILPFHVNAGNQSARSGRNHWVLALLDIRKNTFTTWGIDQIFAERWASAFGSVINGDQPPDLFCKDLPPNPDGASCGLCCCYALEVYLNTVEPAVTPLNMRSYYLRTLLEGYKMSTVLYQLTGRNAVAMRISSADSQEEDLSTDGDMSGIICAPTCLVGPQVATALADRSLHSDERKIRLIQMILHCSMDDHERFLSTAVDLRTSDLVLQKPDGSRIIFDLVKQIEDAPGLYLQAVRSKFLVLKLHLLVESEVSKLEVQRKKARILRRRASSMGHKLDPPEHNRKASRNVVMDQIIETIPGNESRSERFWRRTLAKHLQVGKEYYMLVSHLGLGLLPGLPYKDAVPCKLEGVVPEAMVSETPIRPAEYHEMSVPEASFFVKWFSHLKPDLSKWNRVNLGQFYLYEPFWEEITHLQTKALETINEDVKRSHPPTVWKADLRESKRHKT